MSPPGPAGIASPPRGCRRLRSPGLARGGSQFFYSLAFSQAGTRGRQARATREVALSCWQPCCCSSVFSRSGAGGGEGTEGPGEGRSRRGLALVGKLLVSSSALILPLPTLSSDGTNVNYAVNTHSAQIRTRGHVNAPQS